jgi:hypothetical protein
MSMRDLNTTEPRLLANLMAVDERTPQAWGADDLGPILRHQLDAPMEADLRALDAEIGNKLDKWNASVNPPIKTLHDLFAHPRPPVELLRLAKDFVKTLRNDRQNQFPEEVATVLYFASIAVALLRCRQRITNLGDDALQRSFEWASIQPWVDESLRELLREALNSITNDANDAKTET